MAIVSPRRDFDSVDPQDPIRTHQMMLDTAEQELGIPPVLSSAEMATMAESDRLGLITYLSQFYEAFKTSPGARFWGGGVFILPLSPTGAGWVPPHVVGWVPPAWLCPLCAEAEEVSKKPLSPHGARGAILFLSKLQKRLNLNHKRVQVRDPHSDPCDTPKRSPPPS